MSDVADFNVEHAPTASVLRGVMRLESPEAYEAILGPLRVSLLAAPGPYTIDLAGLVFLNSSGIRALGDVVLCARAQRKAVVLVGAAAIPWQKKTFASFAKLYPAIEIRLT
jgi:hypothetical protein